MKLHGEDDVLTYRSMLKYVREGLKRPDPDVKYMHKITKNQILSNDKY